MDIQFEVFHYSLGPFICGVTPLGTPCQQKAYRRSMERKRHRERAEYRKRGIQKERHTERESQRISMRNLGRAYRKRGIQKERQKEA